MTTAWRLVVVCIAAMVSGCGGCGDPDAAQGLEPGDIIGRVEIDQDIPQPGCKVRVLGTPRGATCNNKGEFEISLIDPGRWELEIVANETESVVPARKITTAANPGFITDLGAIRIGPPGRIGGHVTAPPGIDLPYTVIAVEGFPAATQPDPINRGYVLSRVPAGIHTVVMTTENGDTFRENVIVRPNDITLDINFSLDDIQQSSVNVLGGVAVSGSSDRSNIVVELVETVGGTVKATLTTGDEGTFSLPATSGIYLVRAHRQGSQLTATLPNVLVHGQRNVELQTILVIPAEGDIDGDGVADDRDDDTDGDGVPNVDDAFDLDPNEALDADGDGVGNNVDLDSNGDGGVDRAVATPDSDGDGFLDFEDVCPTISNSDQLDTDGDRAGNLCDNCPGVPNKGQEDADSNGTGDVCEPCIAGEACTPANNCNVGITECNANGAVCFDTGAPKPAGVSCGLDQVCLNGSCQVCSNGDSCTTSSGGACIVGVQSCSTGAAECLPTAIKVADGTPCGNNQVCDNGLCVGCTEGGACPYAADPCTQGALSCDTGLPQTCEDSGQNAPDGTVCNTNQVCLNGGCVTCPSGDACSPTANPCHVGVISCGTGAAVCVDQGTNAADGSPCTGPGYRCSSGTCVLSPNSFSIISGGNQTANTGALLAATTVRLADGSNNPLVGETVSIQVPAGASVDLAPGPTDANGQTTFRLRLGPTAGTQLFVVTSPAAGPMNLPMTATAVAAGGVATVIGAEHLYGNNTGIPGPGSQVRLGGTPSSIAVAPDGSIYFAQAGFTNIWKMDTGGYVTLFAGGGFMPAPYGDGGDALDANLGVPSSLLVDNGYLYFISQSRIRRINFATNIISTVAGGGTAGGPGYGDNGSALAADIGAPASFVFGPGGNLYIADYNHNRIRRVDSNGVITAYLDMTGCGVGVRLGISSGYQVKLAMDTSGQLFIAGNLCGTEVPGTPYGVVRRDPDGTLVHIAGNTTGGVLGEDARYTFFTQSTGILFDAGGHLIYAETGDRIRRIDAQTFLVSNVIGTGAPGSATEYASASTEPVDNPQAIALSGNDLLFGDANYSIRRIGSVGNTTQVPVVMAAASTTSPSIEIVRQTGPQQVRLSTALGGTDYNSLRVHWDAIDPAMVLSLPFSKTSAAGIAAVQVRSGLLVGPHRFTGSFKTLHGAHVTGSPVTFTINATAPTGSVFTVVNVSQTTITFTPGPASVNGVSWPTNAIVASDGTIYFTDYYYSVYKVTPVGLLSRVAGNGVNSSPLGDGGVATLAGLSGPDGLALDELTQRLYIADVGHDRIRYVDLVSGLIYTIAGGATGLPSPYGDGGAATSAELSSPFDVELGPDNALYIASAHNNIRRVDLASPFHITTYLAPVADCAGGLGMQTCSAGNCEIEWSGNALYIGATVCGTGVPSTAGIIRRNADMSMTHILGSSTGSTGENVSATAADVIAMDGMAIASNGDVYYADGNRVRRIVGGMVNTLAGSTSTGSSGDYGPAASVLFNAPSSVAITPDGHVVVVDYANHSVRMIW